MAYALINKLTAKAGQRGRVVEIAVACATGAAAGQDAHHDRTECEWDADGEAAPIGDVPGQGYARNSEYCEYQGDGAGCRDVSRAGLRNGRALPLPIAGAGTPARTTSVDRA